MANISLTDLGPQQAEIERRRRMAEMLQQQASAPIDVQYGRGTPAPIPLTATLGKVLAGYAAGKLDRDAAKEERQVRQRARDEAGRFIREQQVDPGMTVNEGMIMPEDLKPPGFVDRLKGMVPSQQPQPAPMPPQASPQALGAALAGSPAAPPAQQAPPVQPVQQASLPPASPQALGAALAGTPQPQPVMAGPMVQGDKPQPPELTQADVMPQQAFDPRRQRPMAEQQDRLLQASMSGNPYLEKLAPAMYARNEALGDEDRKFERTAAYDQFKREATLQDKLRYDAMKPEERTAVQKDYAAAKGEGWQGTFADWVAYAQPKFVSTAAGQPLFDARKLGGAGVGGAPSVTRDQLPQFVTDNFPGAVLSGDPTRTPAENAAVNGTSNSAHLPGNPGAQDFTLRLPNGAPDLARMAAEAQRFNASSPPGLKMIYEGPGAKHSTGPHLHLEITEGPHGAPQPVAVGPQRPQGGGFGAQWSLTPEEDAALTKAASEGRVDPTRLNSRTAKIQAKLFMAIPGYDAMSQHATANLMANPGAQQKAMLTTALPEVLQNVRDAGKALKFNDLQFAGKLQAWGKGQLNDPDLAYYMTQRNDAMQTLAQVMSGVGATDMRTKMESEAAPKTMSPRAWDAWYQGQLNALRPRIEMYEKRRLVAPGTTEAIAPKPGSAKPFADPAKEARYQAWKKAHPDGH